MSFHEGGGTPRRSLSPLLSFQGGWLAPGFAPAKPIEIRDDAPAGDALSERLSLDFGRARATAKMCFDNMAVPIWQPDLA